MPAHDEHETIRVTGGVGCTAGGSMSDETRQRSVRDEARARRALLAALRGAVLSFEIDHEGKTITGRYRPAIAATLRERLGSTPTAGSVPVLHALNFYADLLVELGIDGQPAPLGRAALTVEALRVMVHVGPKIAEYVGEWLETELASQEPGRPDGTAQA
jgi:hypothetical protein